MSKVKIRNIINRTIILADSNMRFRREIRPNQVATVDSEKLDELMSSIGVANLFKRGFLRIEIENEAIRQELEIFEDMGIGLDENKELMSEAELVKFLGSCTDYDLKTKLENEPESRYPVYISAALKTDGLSFSKIDLIDKFTGKNILNLRKLQKDMES